MNHQDWNPISLNAKVNKKSKANSLNTTLKTSDIKIQAPVGLGKLISQARRDKTRKMLAQELGIAETMLTRWESGKDLPSNLDIAKIEKCLKIQLPRINKIKIKSED